MLLGAPSNHAPGTALLYVVLLWNCEHRYPERLNLTVIDIILGDKWAVVKL
jgi:hypothetical protein